jgi:hypothetical protein
LSRGREEESGDEECRKKEMFHFTSPLKIPPKVPPPAKNSTECRRASI